MSILKYITFSLFLSTIISVNYKMYSDMEAHILIPESEYHDEEPLEFKMSVFSNEFNKTRVEIPNFCKYPPLDIEFNHLTTFSDYNAYIENPEFLSINDFVYFLDRTGYLKIYMVQKQKKEVKKEDEITDETEEFALLFENEIKLDVEIWPDSTIYMFGDPELERIYVIIDKVMYSYTLIANYRIPSLINKYTLEIEDIKKIVEIMYDQNNCFFMQILNSGIDLHCLTEYEMIVKSENVLNSFFNDSSLNKVNITDIWIDEEEDFLYVADYNKGIYFFNINNTKNISLNHVLKRDKVISVRKYMQSLLIISQSNVSYGLENYIEEYLCAVNSSKSLVNLNLIRRIRIGTTKPDLHLVRNYVILLQSNFLKLYRHSMPSEFQEFVKTNLFEDILQIHRLSSTSYNMFIAVFPNKMSLYSIETVPIHLNCFPNKTSVKNGNYIFKFEVFTSTCDIKLRNILQYKDYVVCKFEFESFVDVVQQVTSNSNQTALIIGLTVGMSFLILLVLLLVCWLRNINHKYELLEGNSKINEQNIEKNDHRRVFSSVAGANNLNLPTNSVGVLSNENITESGREPEIKS